MMNFVKALYYQRMVLLLDNVTSTVLTIKKKKCKTIESYFWENKV